MSIITATATQETLYLCSVPGMKKSIIEASKEPLEYSVVALFPIIFSQISTFALSKAGYADGLNVSLGGTSIIIMVGVALETVKQLESQMMMRHYKGFLD